MGLLCNRLPAACRVALDIFGLGAVTTGVVLGEVGDVRRFPSKAHFASYTGTAPIDASSGDHVRHRLNRGGNRRLYFPLHVAATVQASKPGLRREYCLRRRAAGKSPLEAMRCLKRRLSDVVFRALLDDWNDAKGRSREDTWGRLSSAARLAQLRRPALRTSHPPSPTLGRHRRLRTSLLDTEGSRYPRLVAVLALLLAVGGGVVLAGSAVADVPSIVLVVALAAWLVSLALVVVDAITRSRREDTSVVAAAGTGVNEAGRWLREFMP